jgi:hypothetical protein
LCDFFFYKKRKQEKECTSFRTLVSYTFGKKNSGHFDQIKEVALATFFFLNWFESLVIKKEKNQFCYFQRSSSSPLTCLFFFVYFSLLSALLIYMYIKSLPAILKGSFVYRLFLL